MVNIDLASFSFDTSEIVAGAAALKKEIDALKQQQKELTAAGETASETYVQNSADLKTLNGLYNEHIKYLADSNKQTLDATIREEALNAVMGQEVTTIKGLREQNKILNDLRNSANITTAEGRAELEQLNAKLNENNALIKENVDDYARQKIGIGDYASGIKSALAEMNPFNVSISVFIQNAQAAGGVLPMLTNGLKAVTTGIFGMTKAALAFLATPVGAVIGILGAVLGTVINYLKSTQSGMDAVTKVTRPLSAVFQALIGILQEVGKFLFEAFSKPQETLKALYDFVKNQIMRQFESFGKILEGIFTLDFGLIKEGFSDLAEQAKENLDLIAGAGKAMVDRMKDAYRAGVEIDRLQKEIEQSEIDIITSRAKNTLALKEQETLMENQLASSQERSAAIEEHKRLTLALIAEEEEIIKKKIRQLELQQSLNDTTREQQKELAELQAQLISNQEKRTEAEKKANTVIKQLADEQKRNAEKAQADRLKREKELIDLYIAEQGIKSRTLDEQFKMEQAVSEKRLALLDNELKARKISQEQYAKQVLEIHQNLARMEAELAVENAGRELTAYKRAFEEQMQERKFLSDAVVEEKTNELTKLMEQEKAFQKLRLEQGLINQQEFDDAIFELAESNRVAIAELNKEREAVEKQEALELRALEFEEELARMLEEGATRFEIEQAQISEQFSLKQEALNEQLAQGIISQELYNARLEQLNRQRADAEKKNETALAKEKFAIATGLLDSAANIINKESKAGKALAFAKAAMNMYQGISAGVALGFPAAIPAVAFAATTGAKAMADISKTKIPSATGKGDVGGGGGDMSNSSAINLTGKNVNLGSANTGVQTKIMQDAGLGDLAGQIGNAVKEGAQQGTQQGSEQGITNLSANKNIMEGATF